MNGIDTKVILILAGFKFIGQVRRNVARMSRRRLISHLLVKIEQLCMIDKREEVCPVCYKFLNTIYDRKKMKNLKLLSVGSSEVSESYQCKSIYHKKLTDRPSSSL